jgi:phosphoglycolate phosphatase
MALKCAIFDLDGTLMNAYPAVAQSVNYTMSQMGLPSIPSGTIKRTVGWGERHLLEAFVGQAKVEKALKIYRRHHRKALVQGTKLLPGAKSILKYLKRKQCHIAVASNRPIQFSRIAVRHLGITEYLDYMLCGDQVPRPKPYPDMLLKILECFGLIACEALYIGDMSIDIQAGHKARIKTVAVATGSCTKEELGKESPYRTIDRMTQLVAVIKEMEKL